MNLSLRGRMSQEFLLFSRARSYIVLGISEGAGIWYHGHKCVPIAYVLVLGRSMRSQWERRISLLSPHLSRHSLSPKASTIAYYSMNILTVFYGLDFEVIWVWKRIEDTNLAGISQYSGWDPSTRLRLDSKRRPLVRYHQVRESLTEAFMCLKYCIYHATRWRSLQILIEIHLKK